jgi:fimbrial isopeptide formation D2 family protein/LPXTG-motif cell wall-anchored protein
MKHLFRKSFAVLLAALTLCFALATAAFAADPTTVALKDFTKGTIQMTNLRSGDSFDVYQVIAVTYDSTTNVAKYDFSANAKAYIAAQNLTVTVKDYQSWASDSPKLLNFLSGFAAYLQKATTPAPDYTAEAKGDTLSINVKAAGQYLVLGTGNTSGCYVYQLMTASFLPNETYCVPTTCNLACKSSTPAITKSVNVKQVNVGDTVTYTITFNVPTFAANAINHAFYVTDVLPAGVTPATAPATVTATPRGENQTAVALTADAYTFASETAGLKWTFDTDKIATYASITITLTCTVNDNISLTSANTNTAVLHYSNNPFGAANESTMDSTADIYYSGVRLTKYGKDDAVLPGTVFDLYRVGTDEAVATGLTTDKNGQITVKGLHSGDYYFKEVKAVTGYVISDKDIPVTLPDRTGSMTDAQKADMADGLADVTATNSLFNFILPHTGGTGTWIFTIVGVLLMASAVTVVLVHKKKSGQ